MLRRINCDSWGIGLFVLLLASTSWADTVQIYVGTPTISGSSGDYAWSYPITAYRTTSSPTAESVNLRSGDGLVLYDFAGFTGQWSITGGSNNFFSQGDGLGTFSGSSTSSGNAFEDTTLLSNDLDSSGSFSGPTEANLQKDVNDVSANALAGFTDKNNIDNLTFEYSGSTNSFPGGNTDIGEVGTATLIVYSTFGSGLESVYGSVTDGDSSNFSDSDDTKNDYGGVTLVATAPLPMSSITGLALLGVIGITRLGRKLVVA